MLSDICLITNFVLSLCIIFEVISLLRVMCHAQNGSTVIVDMRHSYSSVMELPFKKNILVPFLLSKGNISHSKSYLITINPSYNTE
jgi:hypothetical protein